MGILRWLLCHSLAIIILIALAFLYAIRDDINDNSLNLVKDSASAQKNEAKTLNNRAVVQKKKAENIPAQASSKKIEIKASTVKPQRIENDPWGEAFNDTATPSGADQVLGNAGQESRFPPENYNPESGAMDRNTSQPIASARPWSESTSTGNINGERLVSANKEYFTALEEARRLYWQGQTDLAQAAYERLMFDYQDMPEAAEELGNLLLQRGNKNGATWAYKNAIPRYLNLHREQEAISIMNLLSQYDPVVAEKLQKKYW